MRRLLLIALCLAGLWLVVWALRRQTEEFEPEPLVEEAPPEPSFEPEPPMAERSGDDGREPVVDVRIEPELDDAPTTQMQAVEEPVVEPEPGVVEQPAPEVEEEPEPEPDPEQLLEELSRIRAEVVERVERRPLFVMAEQRGVPYFRLFFMTKPELFEAVLEAEGIPPADVRPSADTAERVRALAAEAFRRHEEIAAEEAAEAKAG
jgi:hypothetical protein